MAYSIKLTDGTRLDLVGESDIFIFTNFGNIRCMEVHKDDKTVFINTDHIVSITAKGE